MNPRSLSVVILAAGKGTRMKSTRAKVLHEVFYQPMAAHIIAVAQSLNPLQVLTVTGHQREAVEAALAPWNCDFIEQKEQLGTGHAVLISETSIPAAAETVLILCGDTPLILPETLKELCDFHCTSSSDVTLLTTTLANPFGYGRILSDAEGNLQAIVEEKDASDVQRQITEVNAGIYCVQKSFLFEALKKIGTDNTQKEMYLTDIIDIGTKEGRRVKRFNVSNPVEVLGVNSRRQLSEAERELQMRHNFTLMAAGVSMIMPETIRIQPTTTIAFDTVIEPSVHICGSTTIESDCHIEQGCVLKDCTIASGCVIGAGSHLDGITCPENSIIQPHTCKVHACK
ncbi:bifunctional N-acetylglucosamine-1-phosphate uridyltransferase/glucosamine-1-phosphate acetyltransferase [Desulforhopalus vacuolatus]|uniref:bifunctional UDP-N-acetylglucosamine diphosphorylase/glucosamine-1-phosphate N-acetyltransferase GlmU n=1 Tax=Desulforhopalus vacuolatus TaxID=40414 RepID=UPI001966B1DF|nr:NTP transferase domain-containing protein [Desulforhopalus vacuolatus]MBM9520423.1 bifunctional N-acetylglucosamine-1-phosphate uridyltransferase/glucosamine-1-phosphate acetyltransferase [Desulforhopalus vacuolatus]